MIKAIKKVKLISITLMLLLVAVLVSNLNAIKAEDETIANKERLSYYSCIHWITENGQREIPEVGSSESLPIDSDLLLHIYLRSTDRQTSYASVVKLKQYEGIRFQEYYPGVLMIGKEVASEEQYYALLSEQGLESQLYYKNELTFTLRVRSTGTSADKIHTYVQADLPIEQDSYTFESVFRGNYEVKAEPQLHTINFFGFDGEIVSTQEVEELQAATIPSLTKEGYTFIGFNTNKDGSGVYYQGEGIQGPMELYAVFEKQAFNVNYYVDNKLYAQRVVNYGDTAEYIEVPSNAERTFTGWDASLENITANQDVHAIFKAKIKPRPSVPNHVGPDFLLPVPSERSKPTVKKEEKVVSPKIETDKEIRKEESKKIESKITKSDSVDGSSYVQVKKNRVIDLTKEKREQSPNNQVATKAKDVTSDSSGLSKVVIPFGVSLLGIAILLIMKKKSL